MSQQDQGQQRQQDQNQQHAGNKPGQQQIDVSQFEPQQLASSLKRTWTPSQISQLCQMLQD